MGARGHRDLRGPGRPRAARARLRPPHRTRAAAARAALPGEGHARRGIRLVRSGRLRRPGLDGRPNPRSLALPGLLARSGRLGARRHPRSVGPGRRRLAASAHGVTARRGLARGRAGPGARAGAARRPGRARRRPGAAAAAPRLPDRVGRRGGRDRGPGARSPACQPGRAGRAVRAPTGGPGQPRRRQPRTPLLVRLRRARPHAALAGRSRRAGARAPAGGLDSGGGRAAWNAARPGAPDRGPLGDPAGLRHRLPWASARATGLVHARGARGRRAAGRRAEAAADRRRHARHGVPRGRR